MIKATSDKRNCARKSFGDRRTIQSTNVINAKMKKYTKSICCHLLYSLQDVLRLVWVRDQFGDSNHWLPNIDFP